MSVCSLATSNPTTSYIESYGSITATSHGHEQVIKSRQLRIPDSEALKAIRILCTYEEQRVEGDSDFGRVLGA